VCSSRFLGVGRGFEVDDFCYPAVIVNGWKRREHRRTGFGVRAMQGVGMTSLLRDIVQEGMGEGRQGSSEEISD